MQSFKDEDSEAREALLVMQSLGDAVRLSNTVHELLPRDMALLLLRLALAQFLRDAAEQVANEAGPE
ncbi:hypothetical protein [Methylocystis echinoides]|uniref:hypothetical protein n=1 Tax=Methylocystis echinoides TaxID=29468 RepID=UPI0034423308